MSKKSKRQGGNVWKKKGRLSAYKQYQIYCKQKISDGMCPNGQGGWMPITSLGSQNIRRGYECQQGCVKNK